MASKRKKKEDWQRSKRQRMDRQGESAEEGSSVRQRADKYRLATAKLPLDALTRSWKNGRNRGLSRRQVAQLRRDFEDLGLFREAEENYLLVQCSSTAVEKMLRRLGLHEEEYQDKVYDFDEWEAVNGGVKLEVMDGQHRMEALRQYSSKKLWWTCYIYDKGE